MDIDNYLVDSAKTRMRAVTLIQKPSVVILTVDFINRKATGQFYDGTIANMQFGFYIPKVGERWRCKRYWGGQLRLDDWLPGT